MIDAHIHILPGIDDGSSDPELSRQMYDLLTAQGVEQIIATPHFYAHHEKTVAHFLEKRRKAYERIGSPANMRLGAEVAIEHGISALEGVEQLAFQGSDLILLEFPYTGYSPWMEEEIYNFRANFGLTPVIAHVHRCLASFSKAQMAHLLEMNVIFQVNNEAFSGFREGRFIRQLLRDGYPVIFGSDAHSMGQRRPNFDVLQKKVKAPVIAEAMALLERHLRPINTEQKGEQEHE